MKLNILLPALLAASLSSNIAVAQGIPNPAQAPMSGLPIAGVRKLTDPELGCAEIQAELAQLEHEAAGKRAQAAALVAQFQKSQEEMIGAMRSAGPPAAGMGLAALLPGGSMVSSLLAQSAASGRAASVANYNRTMQALQRDAASTQMDIARAEARSDHLIGLHQQKGCRAPGTKAPDERRIDPP